MSTTRSLSVLGKPSLASNVPIKPKVQSLQNIPFRVTSLSTKTTSLPLQNHVQPKKKKQLFDVFGESSISDLQNEIYILFDKIESLLVYNKAPILYEKEIIGEMNNLKQLFKILSSESKSYYKICKAIEDSFQTNRVASPKSLKSAFLSFQEKWNSIRDIIQSIKNEGNNSLCDYIKGKFKSIENMISQITNSNNDSVHRDSLQNSGNILKSHLLSLSKSTVMSLSQDDHLLGNPTMLDNQVNDIKSFVKSFSEIHYTEFPKSRFLSFELSQFKSSVLTVSDEIIIGIRAGFSFPSDINDIIVSSDHIDERIQAISEEIDTGTSKPQLKPRANSEFLPDSVRANCIISDFQPEMTISNEKLLSLRTRIDSFIDQISSEFSILIEPNTDTIGRIDIFQDELMKSKKRIIHESQSNNIKLSDRFGITSMGSYESSSGVFPRNLVEKEKNFKTQIAELELQNKELMDQLEKEQDNVNKLQNLVDKLRISNDDEKTKKCLQNVAERMNSIIQGNENEYDFLNNDDLVEKVEKLSLFVLERRCKQCQAYEEAQKRMRKALKNTIGLKNGEPLVTAIESFAIQFTNIKEHVNSIEIQLKEKEKEISVLVSCNNEILMETSKQLESLGISSYDLPPTEIAALTLQAFHKLKTKHQDEIQNQQIEFLNNRKNELNGIEKRLERVFGDDVMLSSIDDPKLRIDTMAEKINLKMHTISQERDMNHTVLKTVENWMSTHYGVIIDDMPVEDSVHSMMMSIDRGTTPVQKQIEQLTNERDLVKTELSISTHRICGLMRYDYIEPDKLSMEQLINQFRQLIEKVHNDVELKDKLISDLFFEIESAKGNTIRSIERLSELLELEKYDISNLSLDSLSYRLGSLLDELSSSSAKWHFVSNVELNRLTADARRIVRFTQSPDPREYIPQMSTSLIQLFRSVQILDLFEKPLQSIFNDFDFKFTSFDSGHIAFSTLRDNVFHLNAVMSHYVTGDIHRSVVKVISQFVSLSSSLFSMIASKYFDSKGPPSQ